MSDPIITAPTRAELRALAAAVAQARSSAEQADRALALVIQQCDAAQASVRAAERALLIAQGRVHLAARPELADIVRRSDKTEMKAAKLGTITRGRWGERDYVNFNATGVAVAAAVRDMDIKDA